MSRPPSRLPRALLAAGCAVFLLGAILALALLPEWRGTPDGDAARFVAAFHDLARRLAIDLSPEEPHVALAADSELLDRTYRALGGRAAGVLAASRTALHVQVWQPIAAPGGQRPRFSVALALDGRPWAIAWREANFDLLSPVADRRYEDLSRALQRALLRPGEATEPPVESELAPSQLPFSSRIAPAAPPQFLAILFSPPARVEVERAFAPVAQRDLTAVGLLLMAVTRLIPAALILLVVLGAFTVLLAWGRLDVWNAALLAGAALAARQPSWIVDLPAARGLSLAVALLVNIGPVLWIFFAWSVGESLLRVSLPGFTTSLESLRHGRLGPRGARALLAGLGCGAALAGGKLALDALAVLVPGLSPAGASLALPVFRSNGSPLSSGILLAASILPPLGLAVRFLAPRWVYPATIAAFAVFTNPIPLHPAPAGYLAGAAFAALLAWAGRRLGLTTLLTSAIVSQLLPAALFSARQLRWMPGTFALCAALLAGIAVLGAIGLRRSGERESEPLPQPVFIRRLEAERRVRHEVDLLGRMQTGLLPREPPSLPGYEIAVRSALAGAAGGDLYDFHRDDGGRLWLVAGDVAGSGYPCAVAQAMIKATLLSLIEAGASPDRILEAVDRVLRRAHLPRRFSTLSLLALDPGSGDVALSNAGHPYPLMVADRRLAELEIPGLPLGLGPRRTYGLLAFTLPPSSLLVLYSDGIAGALDRTGEPYGFTRVREVVEVMGHRPPLEVADALLNDARRHLGGEPADDDMTIVVLRRS